MTKIKGILVIVFEGIFLGLMYVLQILLRKLTFLKGFLVLLYFIFSLLIFWVSLSIFYPEPYFRLEKAVRIDVKRGMSISNLANELKLKGVILFKQDFLVCVTLTKMDKKIKAGRYWFEYRLPSLIALKKLVEGGRVYVNLTIPEGYNIFEIANLFADSLNIDSLRFVSLAEDSAFMDSIGVPAKRAEGFLFPDTYSFTPDVGEREIIIRMFNRFKEVIKPSFYERAKELGMGFYEILILASIIEKEGKSRDELAKISAVYHNRLRLGMRLQADPTVLYGLRVFDRPPTYADLQSDTPYNTYRYNGLPPSPICNPGLASIEAALYPEKNDYLYFVLAEGGKHIFSKNLDEHTKNVIKYRRREKRN